jgi:hypothetical protein
MFLNPVEKIHIYLVPLPLGIVAITFAMFETLVVYFQPDLGSSNVAHIAHIAGLMTGAVFAFFYEPKKATKGIFVLVVCILLLMLLSPLFVIISGIGTLFLQALELIFGSLLYGIANLISVIWWF